MQRRSGAAARATRRDEETKLLSSAFIQTHPVPDHPDQFEIAAQLRHRFYEIGGRFLLTELKAGLALLDVADTSQNGAFNERRRALALEAYEVVADRLARICTDASPLTVAERSRIRRLHRQLGDRLGRQPHGA